MLQKIDLARITKGYLLRKASGRQWRTAPKTFYFLITATVIVFKKTTTILCFVWSLDAGLFLFRFFCGMKNRHRTVALPGGQTVKQNRIGKLILTIVYVYLFKFYFISKTLVTFFDDHLFTYIWWVNDLILTTGQHCNVMFYK